MIKKVSKGIKITSILLIAVSIIAAGILGTANIKASASTKLQEQTEKIVNKKVKQTDSKKKKLNKLFRFVEKNYDYKRTMDFVAYNGWQKNYASEMYSEKSGSCYHFAAAYAFLAKKASGCNTRIGIGKTNGFSGALQGHAWVEVNINSTWYICDPNMDKYAASSSGKYFLKKRNKLKSVYNNFKNVQYFTVAF